MRCLCCNVLLNERNLAESFRLVCRECEQTEIIDIIFYSPCGGVGCDGNDCVACIKAQIKKRKALSPATIDHKPFSPSRRPSARVED